MKPRLIGSNPFFNKNGDISRAGLACGYVQRACDDSNVQLYREHECYHVYGELVAKNGESKTVRVASWSLTLARRAYRRLRLGKLVETHPDMSVSIS